MIIVIVVICYYILYAAVPNLWIRVFHRYALRKLPQSVHQGKRIVLTFDDGPDAQYTPRLLDALKNAGIYATFFVIASKALNNPQIMERMQAEGHDIQLHGFRHVMVPFLPPRLTTAQVAESSHALSERYDISTHWYRPTWGLCNAVTLLSRQARSHRLVTWSVMVGDWKRTDADVLLGRIEQAMHPGAIIVLHDSDETLGAEANAPESVIQLIPHLVRNLQNQGYEFVTLSAAMSGPEQS